jgi:transcriptional regulator with XRE-family HTH domain
MHDETRLLKIIGKNVREHRRRLHLTQMELAAEIGVDKAYISTVERADGNPSARKIARIAAALGVHPADLLDDRKKPRKQ